MARKKSPEKPPNHERWLVSYGDFITLLFAVFVTLYAMSQTDKQKVAEVAASYRSAFGVSAGAGSNSMSIIQSNELKPIPALDVVPKPPSAKSTRNDKEDGGQNQEESDFARKPSLNIKEIQNIKKSIKVSLKPLQLGGDIAVVESARGLVIRLEENAFFESGSAVVKPASLPSLSKIARTILPYADQIRIEGHTDNMFFPTNSYTSNWELSLDRAANIMRLFLGKYDFSPANISIAGYGDYRPIASNDSDEGRKKNRRVDIVLLGMSSKKAMP